MAKPSQILRAQLAARIRTSSPADWKEFSSHWSAFNAIYGGEPDRKERSRVMASIRRSLSDRAAVGVLRKSRSAIDRILETPPGNMLLDRLHPNFRAASIRFKAIYRNPREKPLGRLAAVGGLLYQVRCNLLHGSKDPHVARDNMLVRESVAILKILLPELEAAITTRNSAP